MNRSKSERQQRIAQQLANRDEVRAKRKRERQAWKKALSIYPFIRNLCRDGSEISNPDSIAEKVLEYHIAQQSQIPFVGFWGVGDKQLPNARDNLYIAELNAIRQSVQNQYEPGASITIIFADLHGQFNGFIQKAEDNNSSPYLSQVAELLAKMVFRRYG